MTLCLLVTPKGAGPWAMAHTKQVKAANPLNDGFNGFFSVW